MFAYIIRRLLIAVPVLLGITIVNFFIMNLAPGSPIEMLLDPKTPLADIEMRKDQLGLNDQLWKQYLRWLDQLVHGNLGFSFTNHEPVTSLIAERIGPTLLLVGTALIVGVLIAIPLGVISATRQNSAVDYITTGASFLGISIPHFFLGLTCIYIFALELSILPTGGMTTLGGDGGVADKLKHVILPATVLAIGIVGKKVRYVRASLLETLGQDYLRTARAKGLSEFVVTNKHALRNALIPIITVIGLEIPVLLGGTVVIEQIFQWPGIGQLMIQSILARDYPTIMGLTFISAIAVLLANLLTDIVYSIADPRITYE